ncbi:hypothetical protein AURDEDRAFT_126726 [Auricularia subglabra TFB-10046 SS5]|nr:hypothetical protein AURDEDRAFT_126726 [Auricularia subglabra TFB-10046 SS5]
MTKRIRNSSQRLLELQQCITCPADFCNSLLHPFTDNGGRITYTCVVGRHGVVATVVEGEVKYGNKTSPSPPISSPSPVITPNPPPLVESAPAHQVTARTSHLYTLILNAPPPSLAESGPADRAPEYAAYTSPEKPLVLTAPPPLVESAPAGQAHGPTGHISRPRLYPPSRPFSPERHSISAVITFVDTGVEARAAVFSEDGFVRLDQQSVVVWDILHLAEVQDGTLSVLAPGNVWVPATGPIAVGTRDGAILRAKTASETSAFPMRRFKDMHRPLERFADLLRGPNALSEATAFEKTFGFVPRHSDLESLGHCARLLKDAPQDMLREFVAGANRPMGTWSAFVHCCRAALDGMGSLHLQVDANYRDSPLLHPARRSALLRDLEDNTEEDMAIVENECE